MTHKPDAFEQQDVQPAEGEPVAKPVEAPQENFYDQLLKLKAEFENYRKRTDREKPEFYKQGKAEMLLRLLPVYDVLRKAHAEVQAAHAETSLARGMDMIFKEFEKVFKDEGVKVMEPLGKPFDPQQHEVLGTVESPGAAEGAVVDMLQEGYLLNDRVLRTAKVRIARKI